MTCHQLNERAQSSIYKLKSDFAKENEQKEEVDLLPSQIATGDTVRGIQHL
jgi:hypothetical protein